MRLNTSMVIAAAVAGACGALYAQTGGSSSPIKPIPGTGSLGPAPGSTFTFIVAGDNRPAKAKDRQPKTPGKIFAAAVAHKAAFVVWTGDTIYGLDSADPKIVGHQYQEFFKLAATAGMPVFTAPGNHEMDVKVKDNKNLKEIGSAKMEALYRTNMGLAKDAPIYGAFSYGNARFVLLNSEEIPPAGVLRSPPAKASATVNLDPGYMSAAQMQWLQQELAANTATHTFLFMHHPIKPKKSDMGLNKANADALVQLFATHTNISYVFASHEHLYYNPQTEDASPPSGRTAPATAPPIYLISGGAGAPLDKDGFNNYLVFSVNGSSITVQLVKL